VLPYRIEYSPEAREHLRGLTAGQRALVLEAVDKQLRHQPDVETRNRKPMRPNTIACWELRVRELRVYYQVEEDPEALVKKSGPSERKNAIVSGSETRRLICYEKDGHRAG
jgi:mRNA-degrading endonuclease RelE of RelBE toxin-antitoxin system